MKLSTALLVSLAIPGTSSPMLASNGHISQPVYPRLTITPSSHGVSPWREPKPNKKARKLADSRGLVNYPTTDVSQRIENKVKLHSSPGEPPAQELWEDLLSTFKEKGPCKDIDELLHQGASWDAVPVIEIANIILDEWKASAVDNVRPKLEYLISAKKLEEEWLKKLKTAGEVQADQQAQVKEGMLKGVSRILEWELDFPRHGFVERSLEDTQERLDYLKKQIFDENGLFPDPAYIPHEEDPLRDRKPVWMYQSPVDGTEGPLRNRMSIWMYQNLVDDKVGNFEAMKICVNFIHSLGIRFWLRDPRQYTERWASDNFHTHARSDHLRDHPGEVLWDLLQAITMEDERVKFFREQLRPGITFGDIIAQPDDVFQHVSTQLGMHGLDEFWKEGYTYLKPNKILLNWIEHHPGWQETSWGEAIQYLGPPKTVYQIVYFERGLAVIKKILDGGYEFPKDQKILSDWYNKQLSGEENGEWGKTINWFKVHHPEAVPDFDEPSEIIFQKVFAGFGKEGLAAVRRGGYKIFGAEKILFKWIADHAEQEPVGLLGANWAVAIHYLLPRDRVTRAVLRWWGTGGLQFIVEGGYRPLGHSETGV